jgi:hypothetical protein
MKRETFLERYFMRFSEFLKKKSRTTKEHLNILGTILTKSGFKVIKNLDDSHDPNIFVRKPIDADPILENLSFDGIRIYARGNDLICFRPQNKENVEPYGSSYILDITGMFKDLIREANKPEKLGYNITKYIIEEVKTFFIDSAKAEKEESPDQGPMGSAVVAGGTGSDYSSMVGKDYNK